MSSLAVFLFCWVGVVVVVVGSPMMTTAVVRILRLLLEESRGGRKKERKKEKKPRVGTAAPAGAHSVFIAMITYFGCYFYAAVFTCVCPARFIDAPQQIYRLLVVDAICRLVLLFGCGIPFIPLHACSLVALQYGISIYQNVPKCEGKESPGREA